MAKSCGTRVATAAVSAVTLSGGRQAPRPLMLRGGASTTHSAGHETADHIGPVAIERACAYMCYNTCAPQNPKTPNT